jgi:hypothetical protein
MHISHLHSFVSFRKWPAKDAQQADRIIYVSESSTSPNGALFNRASVVFPGEHRAKARSVTYRCPTGSNNNNNNVIIYKSRVLTMLMR